MSSRRIAVASFALAAAIAGGAWAAVQTFWPQASAQRRPAPPAPSFPASERIFVSTPFARAYQDLNPVRVDAGFKAPTKIRDTKPEYPAIVRAAGVSGSVIVEVLIGTDGRIAAAHVLRSLPALDQAALDAVKQWEFEPVVVDGTRRPVLMTTAVHFEGE